MDFSFTEEHYEFRDMVRSFLVQRFPAETLRREWEEESSFADLYSELADLGIFDITVPEELGGVGGDGLDLALVLEELGSAGVPEDVGFSAAVLAPAIARYGTESHRSEWLPRLATGEVRGTVQIEGHDLIIGASTADVFLVERDGALYLVPAANATIVRAESMDPTLRLGTGEFDLAGVTPLTTDPAAREFVRAASHTVVASQLIGVCKTLLDMTRDYLLTREQFGRQIGSFQAVKHRMADAVMHVEAARSLAWHAHYCLAHEPEHSALASILAKDAANDASRIANYAALQLHGGIGFTWEYSLHMWLQRGFALQSLFGGSSELQVQIGDHLLAEILNDEKEGVGR